MTVVEIDPAISTVAQEYFDLHEDARLNIVIDDGLAFLQKCTETGKTYKTILFDVDSKDSTIGMSCPPPAFVTKEMLEVVKKCIVANGIFILNMVCRDTKLREQVKNDLKEAFTTIHSFKMDEDINEVLFCMNMDIDAKTFHQAMEASAKRTYGASDKNATDSNMVDLEELLEKLKVQ